MSILPGNEQFIDEVTAIMREADPLFEKTGGSTRHYVRDLLLPMMEEKGLIISRKEPPGDTPQKVLLFYKQFREKVEWEIKMLPNVQDASEYGNGKIDAYKRVIKLLEEIQETEAPAALPMEIGMDFAKGPDMTAYLKFKDGSLTPITKEEFDASQPPETPAPAEREDDMMNDDPKCPFCNNPIDVHIHDKCSCGAQIIHDEPGEPVPVLQGEIKEPMLSWIYDRAMKYDPLHMKVRAYWTSGATTMYHRLQEQIQELTSINEVLRLDCSTFRQQWENCQDRLQEARNDAAVFKEWWEKGKKEIAEYREALNLIYHKGKYGYINGDPAGTLAKMAKEILDKYKPSK